MLGLAPERGLAGVAGGATLCTDKTRRIRLHDRFGMCGNRCVGRAAGRWLRGPDGGGCSAFALRLHKEEQGSQNGHYSRKRCSPHARLPPVRPGGLCARSRSRALFFPAHARGLSGGGVGRGSPPAAA
jgi:hypothetical protein